MHEENTESTITGKVAVVTGGMRGTGKAVAARLVEEGASVAISGTGLKSVEDAVAALSANVAGGADRVFGTVADVSKPDDVKRFIDAVLGRFGSINILVNNAGVGTFRSVADLEPKDWERMIAVNLSGAYYCCHEVLPILRAGGGGDVNNVSSLAGNNAFAGGAGYNASKFGLNGFSEAMMPDHRDDGVRVSYIMPGSVDTEFGGEAGMPWKIAPSDIAEVVVTMLRMPRRTMVSRVEMRPSRPGGKK